MNDSKRSWAAATGAVAAAALLVRTGAIAVHGLAARGMPGATLAYCQTGRYGPGPCVKGPLVDIIASSVISLLLLLTILGCLHVIWRVRWERHLRAHGTRVPGVVVATTRLGPANRRQPARVRVRVEVPGIPGVTARQDTDKLIPQGSQLTVAYDPARPRRRAVVIDGPAP